MVSTLAVQGTQIHLRDHHNPNDIGARKVILQLRVSYLHVHFSVISVVTMVTIGVRSLPEE